MSPFSIQPKKKVVKWEVSENRHAKDRGKKRNDKVFYYYPLEKQERTKLEQIMTYEDFILFFMKSMLDPHCGNM